MEQGEGNADMLLCIGIRANRPTESVCQPKDRAPARSRVPHALQGAKLTGPHANDELTAIILHVEKGRGHRAVKDLGRSG